MLPIQSCPPPTPTSFCCFHSAGGITPAISGSPTSSLAFWPGLLVPARRPHSLHPPLAPTKRRPLPHPHLVIPHRPAPAPPRAGSATWKACPSFSRSQNPTLRVLQMLSHQESSLTPTPGWPGRRLHTRLTTLGFSLSPHSLSLTPAPQSSIPGYGCKCVRGASLQSILDGSSSPPEGYIVLLRFCLQRRPDSTCCFVTCW